jgi:hypothetical protein
MALIASALAVTACTDTVAPKDGRLGTPSFALDQFNGTFGFHGRFMIKGFNTQSPRVGDAIVATFYWIGSTNVIDSVTDVLTTNPYTRVGNKYTLVEYVTAGGISMATYVAFNVQGFPDAYNAPGQDSILAVRADLSDSVTGGMSISAYTGVASVTAQALGEHRSASGTGSSPTMADAGSIAVNAGAHVYTASFVNALVGRDPPAGFADFGTGSDASAGIKSDAGYAVVQNAGSSDPQWTWYFDQPSTWLASVMALNPAPPPEPIALDQLNGTFGESGRVLVQGFNPTNPHVGDAVVATFYWVGSTNIIDSVTDHRNAVGYPPIGNTYKLVEYVTAGGISMATYVATNVQNFPDGYSGGDSILVVRANLSDSVTGGLTISAYTGVAPTFLHALGAHSSATGSGSSTTVAEPGSIAVGSGDLAYTTSLVNALVGRDFPPGFTSFGTGSDNSIKGDAAFAVQTNAGTINPPWTWYFNSSSAWLASVVALNGR